MVWLKVSDGRSASLATSVVWVASSRRDWRGFLRRCRKSSASNSSAQTGQHPSSAKPLKGIGKGVVELVEKIDDGDTFGAVYRCVRDGGLCAALLQEEVESGIKTLQSEIELDQAPARDAEAHYAANKSGREPDDEE